MSSASGGIFGGLGREVAELGSRASARFYLQNVVFPMIDGIARKESVSIEEQVANMIRRRETLMAYSEKPELKHRFDETLGNPAVKVLISRFRSHLDKSEDEIRESVPWWVDRIRETRPQLCSVISREPDGVSWLGSTFIDVVQICRRYAD